MDNSVLVNPLASTELDRHRGTLAALVAEHDVVIESALFVIDPGVAVVTVPAEVASRPHLDRLGCTGKPGASGDVVSEDRLDIPVRDDGVVAVYAPDLSHQ